jgi:phosphatidylglycerophosphate synthase
VSFSERVRKSLVFKSTDVEEIIDMYWHRRLAAIGTALILNTGLRPDHITWTSLAVGWAASATFAATIFSGLLPEIVGYPLAAGLLLVSVVLDCMDGQLARAKGGGTRMGRILDGVVDGLVLVPFYVLIGVDILNRFGWEFFALAVVAGLSTFMRTTVYDRVKAFYLGQTLPTAEADGVETMAEVTAHYDEIKRTGTAWEKFLMGMYVDGQLRYGRIFSGRSEDAKVPDVTPESIAQYRQRFGFSMRLMTFMGLGTHMFFMYTSVFLMPWWPWATVATQVIFAGLGIPLLVFAIIRAKALAPV